MRVRNPAFSAWYQMLSSQIQGVSTVEMKSTAGTSLPSGPGTWCVTSTIYSLAPMPSYLGRLKFGRTSPSTCNPQPECAGPVTAPCFFAQRNVFKPSFGQCFDDSPPGYICS